MLKYLSLLRTVMPFAYCALLMGGPVIAFLIARNEGMLSVFDSAMNEPISGIGWLIVLLIVPPLFLMAAFILCFIFNFFCALALALLWNDEKAWEFILWVHSEIGDEHGSAQGSAAIRKTLLAIATPAASLAFKFTPE